MRLLLVPVLLLATMAGCIGGAEPQELGPVGQIDGAALNHILIPYGAAVVTLPELGRETTTTELGGFTFFDVPVGFYVVELDLPGIGVDREVVAVTEGEISRVILQIYPHKVDEPHVTLRSDVEMVQLAMPGAVCDECAWRTSVPEGRPVAVELLVEWDARHPLFAEWHTDLLVEVRDQSGDLIIGPLSKADVIEINGLHVLHARIAGTSLSSDLTNLKVTFAFDAGNPAPHPDFQVDSRLCLHYIEQEPATACSI